MQPTVLTISETVFPIPNEGFSLVEIHFRDEKSTYEVGGVTEAQVDHTGTKVTYFDEGGRILTCLLLKNPPPKEDPITQMPPKLDPGTVDLISPNPDTSFE